MANCDDCGKKFGFLEAGSGGLCTTCAFLASASPEALTQIEANAVKDA
jgi:hypothetical protein